MKFSTFMVDKDLLLMWIAVYNFFQIFKQCGYTQIIHTIIFYFYTKLSLSKKPLNTGFGWLFHIFTAPTAMTADFF